eukprot:gene22595-30862_t
MKRDIRSFFGSTQQQAPAPQQLKGPVIISEQKETQAKETAIVPSPRKQKQIVSKHASKNEDLVILDDSDDDILNSKTQAKTCGNSGAKRKRLKSNKKVDEEREPPAVQASSSIEQAPPPVAVSSSVSQIESPEKVTLRKRKHGEEKPSSSNGSSSGATSSAPAVLASISATPSKTSKREVLHFISLLYVREPFHDRSWPGLAWPGLAWLQSVSSAKAFFGEAAASPPKAVTARPATKAAAVAVTETRPGPHKASSPRPSSSTAASSHLPLAGMKIAVTGVMEGALDRHRLEEHILCLGGKVAASVSGQTSYLVSGRLLEDGRPASEGSKHRTAVEKKVRILSEQQFLDLVSEQQATLPPPLPAAAAAVPGPGASRPSAAPRPAATSSSSSSSVPAPVLQDRDMMLWVDKHVPRRISDMVGSAEVSRKLADWLRRWPEMHAHGDKSRKAQAGKDNPGAKAALLSGPPGIGKTTLATLTAREMDFDVLELNASDTRNKKQLDCMLLEAVSSRAIALGQGRALRQRLVIMDEVDGMGGSDRGGMAELIKVIKISKIPIICICNDRQSSKVRSLANHCFDLRVKRPTKGQIAARLTAVAGQEGLQLDANAAEMLAETSGNDIRQALNALQMCRIEKDKVLRQSPFDACLSLLAGTRSGLGVEDRYNAFFIDYSLVPLLVQHNYIDAAKQGLFRGSAAASSGTGGGGGGFDEGRQLEKLASAAAAVSDMDLIGRAIMGNDQHWELLPAQSASAVRVGSLIQGFQAFPAFPAWLGKYSSTNKSARLTREIVQHTSLSIGQGFGPIRLEYIPYLTQFLLCPLLTKGAEGVPDAIAMLDEYGLDKDDLMETLRAMQFTIENDRVFKDAFDPLEAKVKTALTKAYNSSSHRSQVLVSELVLAASGRGKGKKGAAGAGAGAGAGGLSSGPTFNEEGFLEDDQYVTAEEAEGGEDGEDDADLPLPLLLPSKPKSKPKASSSSSGGKPKAAAGTGTGTGTGGGRAKKSSK